jgi:hypothetical protein
VIYFSNRGTAIYNGLCYVIAIIVNEIKGRWITIRKYGKAFLKVDWFEKRCKGYRR